MGEVAGDQLVRHPEPSRDRLQRDALVSLERAGRHRRMELDVLPAMEVQEHAGLEALDPKPEPSKMPN
jgi:hypothetical protein